MDNHLGEPSTGDLTVDQATEIFANILEPKEEVEGQEEAVESTTDEQSEQEPEQEPIKGEVTIQVDGKLVTLTPEQIAESYKNGLRQSDYTRKTMEIAEERKAAEAEKSRAMQERQAYTEKLGMYQMQLEAALQEQSQTDWAALLEADPVEYLKQQHLYQDRQAKLNQARQEYSNLAQLTQHEQQEALRNYVNAQQQELIAKLPAWKDEAKAKAEKEEIRGFLKETGFTDEEVAQVFDHRHVLLVRDAMQFRKLMKEAPQATKRVQTAPVRAERSGTGENSAPSDELKAAQNRLRRSGSIEDATAVFARLL
jgi:hypothetical protein